MLGIGIKVKVCLGNNESAMVAEVVAEALRYWLVESEEWDELKRFNKATLKLHHSPVSIDIHIVEINPTIGSAVRCYERQSIKVFSTDPDMLIRLLHIREIAKGKWHCVDDNGKEYIVNPATQIIE